MNMNCHPHLVPSAHPIRSSDPSRLTSHRSTRPPPRRPDSAWTERKNRRPPPPARSSPLPPSPPARPPACVHLGPQPRRTRSARVGTLRRDRHDDPVQSLRYRSPGRCRGSTIGTATAQRPSAIVIVVRHLEHARPNDPVVDPVCKVDKGWRVDPPPPPLESVSCTMVHDGKRDQHARTGRGGSSVAGGCRASRSEAVFVVHHCRRHGRWYCCHRRRRRNSPGGRMTADRWLATRSGQMHWNVQHDDDGRIIVVVIVVAVVTKAIARQP
jgi:hypothetical protein